MWFGGTGTTEGTAREKGGFNTVALRAKQTPAERARANGSVRLVVKLNYPDRPWGARSAVLTHKSEEKRGKRPVAPAANHAELHLPSPPSGARMQAGLPSIGSDNQDAGPPRVDVLSRERARLLLAGRYGAPHHLCRPDQNPNSPHIGSPIVKSVPVIKPSAPAGSPARAAERPWWRTPPSTCRPGRSSHPASRAAAHSGQ